MSDYHKRLDYRKYKQATTAVFSRDGYTCQYCGSGGEDDNPLTLDHVPALSTYTEEDWLAGKAYDPDYLVTACRECNSRRQAKPRQRLDYISPRWR